MEDDHPDHRLDPELDDGVRRLLADARHDDPVPDDVAARLDRVLAQLADERPDGKPLDTPRVVDLATQRRRSRARNLLVAAAAVVAVGVGLGQLDLGSVSIPSGDSEGMASGEAAEDTAEQPSSAAKPGQDTADRVDGLALGATVFLITDEPLVVGDQDFARLARDQARRVVPTAAGAPLASAPSAGDESQSDGKSGGKAEDDLEGARVEHFDDSGASAYRTSWFTCERGPFGKGRLVAVEYQNTSAVLAVRPPTGDSVVVELLQCGTATVLRSATVPMP